MYVIGRDHQDAPVLQGQDPGAEIDEADQIQETDVKSCFILR